MKLMVLATLITSSACPDVSSTVKIATAVKQHFRSVCMYLLHDDGTGTSCSAVVRGGDDMGPGTVGCDVLQAVGYVPPKRWYGGWLRSYEMLVRRLVTFL
jgi:hypothetical protein